MNHIKNMNIIALICTILDQLSKYIIISSLSLYETIPVIKGFFSITYVQNIGAAFSILSGKSVLLIIAAIVMIIILNYYAVKSTPSTLETICYGILSGGIIGNLIDRLFRNYVVDFFDFNIFGYNFPVFNLADIFICLSVVVIIILTLKSGDKSGISSKK